MRCLLVMALLAVSVAAEKADDYFDVGIDYLRKGFFDRSRAAFTESLLLAPHEPVTLAFLGVALAAEGRPAREAALLLRVAFKNLGKHETLRLDLRRLLPSKRALDLLKKEYRDKLKRARDDRVRRDLLQVLAFLEVSDGSRKTAPAVRLLDQKSAYVKALTRRPKRP